MSRREQYSSEWSRSVPMTLERRMRYHCYGPNRTMTADRRGSGASHLRIVSPYEGVSGLDAGSPRSAMMMAVFPEPLNPKLSESVGGLLVEYSRRPNDKVE